MRSLFDALPDCVMRQSAGFYYCYENPWIGKEEV